MNKIIVGKINLTPIPNHKLMKGIINGHTVIVGNHYDNEILGFFIPENALVPPKLLEEMWLTGKLAGKQRNRVKKKEMAGILSEGLFYGQKYWINQGNKYFEIISPSWNPDWKDQQDITDELNITFINTEE